MAARQAHNENSRHRVYGDDPTAWPGLLFGERRWRKGTKFVLIEAELRQKQFMSPERRRFATSAWRVLWTPSKPKDLQEQAKERLSGS